MKLLLFTTLAVYVTAQRPPSQTTQEFTKTIDESRTYCIRFPAQRERSSRFDQLQCGGGFTTVHQIYQQIPGNRETVRRYAPADFLKTLDLCASRENNNASDWRKLYANRNKLGVSQLSSQTWADCEAQIKLEKDDCKNAKNVLCAFRQGTSMTCNEPTQMKRKCKTLDIGVAGGDQCNVIEAFGDGRPGDVKTFNERIAESRRGCQQKKDQTEAQCFGENSIALLVKRFPVGVNWKTGMNAYPGLSQTVDMCTQRTDQGFIKIRIKANQIYRVGRERDECMAQLSEEEQTCKKLRSILCAYTYGIDVSCQQRDPAIERRRVPIIDQCRNAVNALETERR